MGLSYREIIECRCIETFRISKSISYRTSHIEYLDILKTSDFFVFFRRKFRKSPENSENNAENSKKSSNSENSPKIPSKEGLFWGPNIVSHREKNLHIVSSRKQAYRAGVVSIQSLIFERNVDRICLFIFFIFNQTKQFAMQKELRKSNRQYLKKQQTVLSFPDSPCQTVLEFPKSHATQLWIFSAFYSPLRTGFILSSFLSVSSIGPLGKFLTLSWCSSVALNFFLNSER